MLVLVLPVSVCMHVSCVVRTTKKGDRKSRGGRRTDLDRERRVPDNDLDVEQGAVMQIAKESR